MRKLVLVFNIGWFFELGGLMVTYCMCPGRVMVATHTHKHVVDTFTVEYVYIYSFMDSDDDVTLV